MKTLNMKEINNKMEEIAVLIKKGNLQESLNEMDDIRNNVYDIMTDAGNQKLYTSLDLAMDNVTRGFNITDATEEEKARIITNRVKLDEIEERTWYFIIGYFFELDDIEIYNITTEMVTDIYNDFKKAIKNCEE